jgi:hypothetical protein
LPTAIGRDLIFGQSEISEMRSVLYPQLLTPCKYNTNSPSPDLGPVPRRFSRDDCDILTAFEAKKKRADQLKSVLSHLLATAKKNTKWYTIEEILRFGKLRGIAISIKPILTAQLGGSK